MKSFDVRRTVWYVMKYVAPTLVWLCGSLSNCTADPYAAWPLLKEKMSYISNTIGFNALL